MLPCWVLGQSVSILRLSSVDTQWAEYIMSENSIENYSNFRFWDGKIWTKNLNIGNATSEECVWVETESNAYPLKVDRGMAFVLCWQKLIGKVMNVDNFTNTKRWLCQVLSTRFAEMAKAPVSGHVYRQAYSVLKHMFPLASTGPVFAICFPTRCRHTMNPVWYRVRLR